MKGKNNLSADLTSAMIACTIAHNSEQAESEEWHHLYNEYLKEKDQMLLTALSYTKSRDLLNR